MVFTLILTVLFHLSDYLAECEENGMAPLLLGRKDASILVLFQTFVSCVIGRKKFKMKLSEQLKRDADICTVSDEAFALLILENQYDH
jgi:hypothetical protein